MEVKTDYNISSEQLLKDITEIAHRHEPDVVVSMLSKQQNMDTKAIEQSEFQKDFKRTIIRFSIGILFFLGGVLFKQNHISFVLFILSYIIFGYDVLWRAIKNIKKGQIFDENFLMSISTVGAVFLEEMAEAVLRKEILK